MQPHHRSHRCVPRRASWLRLLSLGPRILRMGAVVVAMCPAWLSAGEASPNRPETQPAARSFTDLTRVSGVAEAMAEQYGRYPKWWLSGLNLVDLDGDGQLDLFFAAHGAGRSLALRGDGRGHFTPAAGNYPPSEIHLAYDLNEDGKLDRSLVEP